METITVTSKEVLDELYKESALTIEGLNLNSLSKFKDWIVDTTKKDMINERFYIIKGKVMNEVYALTGNNAYPDDINIVSVKLSDISDWQKLVMPRFQIKGRWFDDIVDNNAMRERNKTENQFSAIR